MRYSPFRHLPSVLWKRRPIQLTFFVTKRCNARCPFCFYLSRREEAPQAELNLAEIERISASLGSLLWLAFSGGEIFLREDLVEITRLFYRQNRPAIILFPTNGLQTERIRDYIETILRQCPKSIVVVKLSLDGPEPVHDALRGVPGAFQRTMATYHALGELLDRFPNFDLGINTVYCRATQETMDDTIAFVNGLEYVRTHTVSLVRGEVAEESLKDVDMRGYWATIARMEEDLKNRVARTYRFGGARLKAAQDIVQRRLILQTMVEKQRLIPCYAGRLNLVLTETGDLHPCESFTMKIGNVRDHGCDVGQLMDSDRARQVRRMISHNGCYCTHECYFMTNILFNPALYPALLREYAALSR